MSTVTVILFCSIFIASANGACNIIAIGVSKDDEEIIVNKHNSLRKMLTDGSVSDQPPAINMMTMVYDSELAKVAQNISNTCNFRHVSVKDSRWRWVGQNLHMWMSTGSRSGANWNHAIQSWFDEQVHYTYPGGFSSVTGHYTQVAWAGSTHVGCGYTYFKVAEIYPYRKIYTCNYGPGGNVNNMPPYQTD